MSPSVIRVALADDSVLLREGVARLFQEAGFDVVGTYGDAESLVASRWAGVEGRRVEAPTARISSCSTSGCRRRSATRGCAPVIAIKASHPAVGVLLLSQYAEAEYAADLLDTGASGVGYLLKDRVSSLDELQDAVERIVGGGTVIDEQIVRELLARRHDPLSRLTPREMEVLSLMAEGRTNQGIASGLHLAVASVEKHTTAIFQKLGLDDSGTAHRRVLAVLAWLRKGA